MALSPNGTLGIGTTTMSASNALEVNGAASIGYTNTAAPSNGAIIEGNVGVGTTNPQETLDVAGVIKVAGTGSEVCDATHAGAKRFNPSTGLMQTCFGY